MKTLRLPLAASILAVSLANMDAQQPPATNDKAESPWVIRTFRVDLASNVDLNPSLSLPTAQPLDPFAPAGEPASQPRPVVPVSSFPELPAADASDKEWADHLKENTAALARVFDQLDAPSPPGMAALYDARSSTLVVRTTREHAASLAAAMEIFRAQCPRNVVVTMEVLEADAGLIHSLVEETAGRSDHTPAWKRCVEWLDAGKARLKGQFRVNTRSGQRMSVKSGLETTPVKELQVDSSGRVAAIRGGSRSAMEFEADAIVSPDFLSVDLPFAFRFDYAPPTGRVEKVTALVSTSDIECPVLDYQESMISANLTLAFGTCKLVGVWHPRGKPEYTTGDIMQAAFLKAEAPAALPGANENLAAQLQKHAPAPPAIAKTEPPAEAPRNLDPNAIIHRIIKVDPTFLARAQMEKGNCNVQKWMESEGITFPEGASVIFNPTTSTLNVKNTAATIELIKSYAESSCRIPSWHISCTAYVVEGESSMIRQLADETRTSSDHTKTWERAKKLSDSGSLRVVEVLRGEGRNGDRGHVKAGINRTSIGDIVLNGASNSERATDDGAGPTKPLLTTIPFDSQFVGTSLEWHPVLNSDWKHVEINLAFDHHFAPPSDRPGISTPGALTPAGTPVTRFHCVHLVSSATFVTGTTRLMDTWKTEGSPAHEGRDISQALFLRVDLIPFEPMGK